MKKLTILTNSIMEKEYLAPVVRVIDLRQDLSFCLSGGLDDTYDDPFDFDD